MDFNSLIAVFIIKIKTMNKLAHEELTGRIIACAIEVHKALGPGFLESIYEAAMVVELKRVGIRVEQQRSLPIFYREVMVGEHRLDSSSQIPNSKMNGEIPSVPITTLAGVSSLLDRK